MARNDGRVEKGQSIRSAFSAKAWNRAQDAADIVLGAQPGIEAGSLSTLRLPCVKARFPEKGFFGEVRTIGVALNLQPSIAPSVPASISSASAFGDQERRLINFISVPTRAVSAAAFSRTERALAICISNDDNLYAISGLAVTRIRVFNYHHRFARAAAAFAGQTQQQMQQASGCLDSAFYGPAKILGYATNFDGVANFYSYESESPTPLVWPSHEFRWALVSF